MVNDDKDYPFVYGQSIFYIPDDKSLHRHPFDKEYDYVLAQGEEIQKLKGIKGLASILVSNLACTILEKNIVPFYCASTTNVGSQAVAHRSGFIPCWVSTYRNILDGSSAYLDILEPLKI